MKILSVNLIPIFSEWAGTGWFENDTTHKYDAMGIEITAEDGTYYCYLIDDNDELVRYPRKTINTVCIASNDGHLVKRMAVSGGPIVNCMETPMDGEVTTLFAALLYYFIFSLQDASDPCPFLPTAKLLRDHFDDDLHGYIWRYALISSEILVRRMVTNWHPTVSATDIIEGNNSSLKFYRDGTVRFEGDGWRRWLRGDISNDVEKICVPDEDKVYPEPIPSALTSPSIIRWHADRILHLKSLLAAPNMIPWSPQFGYVNFTCIPIKL